MLLCVRALEFAFEGQKTTLIVNAKVKRSSYVTDRIRTCAGNAQHLDRSIAGCRLNHSATVTSANSCTAAGLYCTGYKGFSFKSCPKCGYFHRLEPDFCLRGLNPQNKNKGVTCFYSLTQLELSVPRNAFESTQVGLIPG